MHSKRWHPRLPPSLPTTTLPKTEMTSTLASALKTELVRAKSKMSQLGRSLEKDPHALNARADFEAIFASLSHPPTRVDDTYLERLASSRERNLGAIADGEPLSAHQCFEAAEHFDMWLDPVRKPLESFEPPEGFVAPEHDGRY